MESLDNIVTAAETADYTEILTMIHNLLVTIDANINGLTAVIGLCTGVVCGGLIALALLPSLRDIVNLY